MTDKNSEPSGPARHTTWRQGLLLAVASLVLLALVGELAARSFSWWIGKGFWQRPNSFTSAFFVTYDWPPPLIEGDRAVFRDGLEVSIRKGPGILRVLCLGGSTTVNARNREGLTYSSLLQSALVRRWPGQQIEVLNAGGDAFSTAHSLVNFSLRGLAFEPDVVTVLHNINDLSAAEFGAALLPDYSNKYLDDAFLAFEHRSGLGGAVLRNSRALQFLRWRVSVLKRALERSSRGTGRIAPDEVAPIFERNLGSIVAVARAHGVVPVLITQAHRDGEASGSDFSRLTEVTRRLAIDRRVELVDASAAMSGRRELFLDPVHLTSEGVRELAAVLEGPIAQILDSVGDGSQP